MNKQMMFLALAVITSYLSLGQSIGIGTNSPHNSAILDINSNNKGMLTPRMTTAQRNVIAAPAKGLLLFDTDVNNFFYYNGTAWTGFSGTGISFPYTTTVNTVTQGFGIINAGSGTGLYGAATIGNGVYGRADAAGGKGVTGFGLNGATGVLASAATGLALDVNGNLRISGGNTSPAKGAVLTSSDDNGNAVWKPSGIAFNAFNSGGFLFNETFQRIQFFIERFDIGNAFKKAGDDPDPAKASEFIAPVNGVYHFDAGVMLEVYPGTAQYFFIKFQVYSGAAYRNESIAEAAELPSGNQSLSISSTMRLKAGDRVAVIAYQKNTGGEKFTINQYDERNYFSGHLVFAE